MLGIIGKTRGYMILIEFFLRKCVNNFFWKVDKYLKSKIIIYKGLRLMLKRAMTFLKSKS